MSLPIEESSILNADIENDVSSSHRNLIETERGIEYFYKLNYFNTHSYHS